MNMWKKISRRTVPAAEAFLRGQEPYCVGASFRFITRTDQDYIWITENGGLRGVLVYAHRILYPVFRLCRNPVLPPFFSLLVNRRPLHAMQGLAGDLDLLEPELAGKGLCAGEKYDYELRSLVRDGQGAAEKPLPRAMENFTGPRGLIIRRPRMTDLEGIFPLQKGYEQEEVLPRRSVFNAAACRRTLEQMIATDLILIAELKGILVGKININAQSFNCLQIGGVYVLPEFRNRGIAQAMTAGIIQALQPLKKKFTLFVKKANLPALRAYDNIGFVKIGDYRINYY
ncbi:MAG: GNAT family N-acetyltransferase [Spirochaetaceae bacterium]|nr:GNAT family N-acetyltransferase [Spirochaetaceae bacterium]